MGSVRSLIDVSVRLSISRDPFPLNLLSRMGLLGGSLCSEREASDYPAIPISFPQKARNRLLAPIDGRHVRGDWKANRICEIGSDQPNVNPSQDWLPAGNRAMCVYTGTVNNWL